MSDLTEFQQRAASVAIVKMLGGKHFSICDLDAIAKTMGQTSAMAGRDYAALQAVHCVDWADMGSDLARMVREKSLELLGVPPEAIDAVCARVVAATTVDQEPTHELGNCLRAFWRKP